MSNFVLGDTVVETWTLLDTANVPITGATSPADITFTLLRQSGSTMVAAAEAVAMTEIGATGSYYITFTPTNLGLYTLELQELHASSGGVHWRFPGGYSILSAGALFVPNYADAFCAESDIERRLNQTISATSNPSDTAASAFAEMRAAVLMSICAKHGYPVTPTTITSGSRLEDMLRDANSIGAALDYSLAQQQGPSPSKSDRIQEFAALWASYVSTDPKAPGLLIMELKGNLASLSTDHILSGDTLANAADSIAPTAEPRGGPIGMGSLF